MVWKFVCFEDEELLSNGELAVRYTCMHCYRKYGSLGIKARYEFTDAETLAGCVVDLIERMEKFDVGHADCGKPELTLIPSIAHQS